MKKFLCYLTALAIFAVIFSAQVMTFASEASEYGQKIPFITSDMEDVDFEFENLYAVIKGENIEFIIKFSGKIYFYSFFNPPDGNKIMIAGETTDKQNQNGIIRISIPLEEFKKYGEITIQLRDEYSNAGWIFLRPKVLDYDSIPKVFSFKDPKFESLVKEAIGKNSDDIFVNELSNIRKLDISQKQITDISGIKYLSNLEELNMANNGVADISELNVLKNLKVLNASSNVISNIDALKGLEALTILDLSHNQIEDISVLSCLPDLVSLKINDNNIRHIEALRDLSKLTSLFIGNNPVLDYEPVSSIYKNIKECDFGAKIIEYKIKNGEINDLNMAKEYENEIITYVTSRFKDIKRNDWFIKNVSYLVGLNIIDGYPDETFKPEGNVTVDAFLKMVVTSLGYKLANGSEYWATPYIEKAKELGLIIEGEYTSYTLQITRQEMARIIIRALNEDYNEDLIQHAKYLKDYDKFSDEYRKYIIYR